MRAQQRVEWVIVVGASKNLTACTPLARTHEHLSAGALRLHDGWRRSGLPASPMPCTRGLNRLAHLARTSPAHLPRTSGPHIRPAHPARSPMPEHTLHPTGQHAAAARPRRPVPHTLHGWQECKAGAAGALISLAPALTMGLLAFAALGPRGAAHGIPAALLASVVGGAVLAALARGPMAAGGPGAATVLPLAALVAGVAADPQFTADDTPAPWRSCWPCSVARWWLVLLPPWASST